MAIALVVARERAGGIGKDGGIPWKRPKGDVHFFRELTTAADPLDLGARYRMTLAFPERRVFPSWQALVGQLGVPAPQPAAVPNIVLMGRKTWDSLPERYRPLPERRNWVLSRNGAVSGAEATFATLEAALRAAGEEPSGVFIIGGGETYAAALAHPACDRLYLTQIFSAFDCDAFFPDPGMGFRKIASSPRLREDGLEYEFQYWERPA